MMDTAEQVAKYKAAFADLAKLKLATVGLLIQAMDAAVTLRHLAEQAEQRGDDADVIGGLHSGSQLLFSAVAEVQSAMGGAPVESPYDMATEGEPT